MALGKVLVLGYYNRNNLGDDSFVDVIPYLFPKSKCVFKCHCVG